MKRIFLLVFILSLVTSAVLSILLVLFGTNFGAFGGKILISTVSIGAYALIGLACMTVYEIPTLRWFAQLGVLLCAVGLVFALLTNWKVISPGIGNLLRFRFLFLSFSLAIGGSALVLRIPARSGLVRFVKGTTVVCIFVAAEIWATFILSDSTPDPNSGLFLLKVLATSTIFGLLGAILTPILAKMAGGSSRSPELSIGGVPIVLAVFLGGILLGLGPTLSGVPDPFLALQLKEYAKIEFAITRPDFDPGKVGPGKTTLLYELACGEDFPSRINLIRLLLTNPKTDVRLISADPEIQGDYEIAKCLFESSSDRDFETTFQLFFRTPLTSEEVSYLLTSNHLKPKLLKGRLERLLAARKLDLNQPLKDGSYLLDFAATHPINPDLLTWLRANGASQHRMEIHFADGTVLERPVASSSPSPTPSQMTTAVSTAPTSTDLASYIGVWKYSLNPAYKIVIYKNSDGKIYSLLRNWGGIGVDRSQAPVQLKGSELYVYYTDSQYIHLSHIPGTNRRLKYLYNGERGEYVELE